MDPGGPTALVPTSSTPLQPLNVLQLLSLQFCNPGCYVRNEVRTDCRPPSTRIALCLRPTWMAVHRHGINALFNDATVEHTVQALAPTSSPVTNSQTSNDASLEL
jgi:hypothetical protein